MRKIAITIMVMFVGALVFAGGQPQAATATDSVQVTPPGAYPIVNQMIELSHMIPANPNVSSYTDNELTEYLEERTNVRIDLRTVSAQDYTNRINLMFAAGGDLPDMLSLPGWNVNTLLLWGTQGVLRPLNDLIDSQGFYFSQAVADWPGAEALLTSADGSIYSLPNMSSCKHCDPSVRLWINQVWIDELGLETPTTTEEFRQVLTAFRDSNPNQVSGADEIPFIGARTGWQMRPQDFLLGSFVTWDRVNKTHMVDGKIVSTVIDPAYREGLAYLNRLVRENLLDPISFTQDQNQFMQLLNLDPTVVGAYPGGSASHFANERIRRTYVHLDPLEGPGGVQTAVTRVYWAGVVPGFGVITTAAEYPEVAMRWLDQFFDLEVSMVARWGQEGRDWREPMAGEVALNSFKEVSPAVMLQNVWGVTQPHNIHWYLGHPFYMPVSPETADWVNFDRVAVSGDSSMKLMEFAPQESSLAPPLAYLPEEVEDFNDLFATIDTYIEESMVRFIVGDLSIETDWDRYVAELQSAGLMRLISIMQTAYDRAR